MVLNDNIPHYMLFQFVDGLADLLYPPCCYNCNASLDKNSYPRSLCASCQQSIKPNRPPFCIKCSRNLGAHIHSNICHNCHNTSQGYDFAWSATIYSYPLNHLIYQFKYGQKTHLRHDFARIMLKFMKFYNLDFSQFDCIIPIPLHPTRLRERGFNQSELLAKIISQKINKPLKTKILRRCRNTIVQSQLSQKERWTNIQDAFTIPTSQDIIDTIKDKSILLIDDLLTSGATCSQGAKTLKKAGAKRVGVLTLSITKNSNENH